MRIIHVVPAISEISSGPSYSVVRLCKSLADRGANLTLAAMDWGALPSSPPPFLKVFPMGVGPKRLGRSPAMLKWLKNEVSDNKVDVIHNHGMWQMNAVYPGWAAKGQNVRLVVSPRGTFSEWAMSHGSWAKKVFWPLLQHPSIVNASCFHATSEQEYRDIRRLGFRQPVAVIPNGVDVPVYEKKLSRTDLRTLLFLGRLHSQKGLEVLLEAWSLIMARFPSWRLSIIGADSWYGVRAGYREELKKIAIHLNLERVEILEPVYGSAKWTAYAGADLFILPTFTDNFAMTVAEALAAGTPVIVTKAAPWAELDVREAGWWIDMGVDSLVAGLQNAMSLSPEELLRRGKNGREWMIRTFSWDTLGHQMDLTYGWLAAAGGAPPSWVRLD